MTNVTAMRKLPAEHRYLSPDQVCDLVPGMTVENLQELRKKGTGPAFCKPTGDHGKVIIYRETDVREWVENSRRGTREQA